MTPEEQLAREIISSWEDKDFTRVATLSENVTKSNEAAVLLYLKILLKDRSA